MADDAFDPDKIRWVFDDEPDKPAAEKIERPPLGLWNAGDLDDAARPPPPRQWILGNTFCRGFLSSAVAEGGIGKTALRIAQAIAVASGRPITGEKVFRKTRVLYISLEDNAAELKRRVRAALMHHGVSYEEIRDQLWLASPGDEWKTDDAIGSYTLAYAGRNGQVKIGDFPLSSAIAIYRFGLVIIDPFVKLHGLDENSNPEIDFLCRILASLAMQHNVAIDVPHHTSKLNDAYVTSRSNRARGGSAFRDAVRLMYTLSSMTAEEAEELGVGDDERRRLVRVDPGKINITLPASKATWFRLVSVKLGNGDEIYPNGDEVQTVVPWDAPDLWKDIITKPVGNQILDALDAGLPDERRYTIGRTQDEDLHAWRIVKKIAPGISESQAKHVLDQWLEEKVIESRDYSHASFRKAKQKGLYVLRWL